MSDHILQQLAESAERALSAQTAQEGVLHLSKAFSLFSEEASRLKTAYAKLQERFQAVNQELASKVADLGRTTHYLNNILRHISDAIVFIDLEGTIAMLNDAAQKLLGLDANKVLFRKYMELFPDDYFGFSMKEALSFGIAQKLLYKSYPQRNQEIEISTSFVYNGPKIYHGMVLVLRDVSEKQKLQRIAHRNDRLKDLGSMAATVAHEIRNPLGGIRGFASLLHRDLKDLPHLQEMASAIVEGTKSLEKIVSAILSYSRPIQIQPQTLDLGAYLRQLCRFIKVDAAFPQNVQLKMHIPDAPLLAPFDPETLKSALLNLIFNAFQAMPQGGALSLSLLKIDASCQIIVSDTGIGMSEELLQNLFSPFFTTKQRGTGLGLVETQKIVQAHFGSLEVRSQEGKGSTFTITLPLKRS